MASMVAATMARFGRIDALVNAAGAYGELYKATHETTLEEWDLVINSNLKGSFLCAKAIIPHMLEAGRGRIINFSSNAGRTVSPILGPSYTVAKTAILGLTRHLAHEYAARGILANTIAPGPVDSGRVRGLIGENAKNLAAQIPIGRLADPTEIADVVAFLASHSARYMTGAIVDVNGGYVLA